MIKTYSNGNNLSTDILELIERYYPLGGSIYVKLRGVNLEEHIIDSEAKSMCVERYKEYTHGSNGWGIDDTDILLKYYMLGGYPLCKEKGIKKSKISVMAKADQLKIKRFSDFEVEVALDTEFTITDKLELIGENRSIYEINNVIKYGVV